MEAVNILTQTQPSNAACQEMTTCESLQQTKLGRTFYTFIPAPRIGKVYRPTGPRLLSPDQIAAAFAKVLDRKVTYRMRRSNFSPRLRDCWVIPIFKSLKSAAILRNIKETHSAKGRRQMPCLRWVVNRPKTLEPSCAAMLPCRQIQNALYVRNLGQSRIL